MNSPNGVRYTSITSPESCCEGCAALKSTRTFCDSCRGDRPCTWYLGREWRTKEGRWTRCCNSSPKTVEGKGT